MPVPPSLLAATGLISGFSVSRATEHRHWGGAVAAGFGLAAAESCRRRSGPAQAVGLGGVYTAALAGSHPLAKKVGAWPSVFVVSGATAVAAGLLSHRR